VQYHRAVRFGTICAIFVCSEWTFYEIPRDLLPLAPVAIAKVSVVSNAIMGLVGSHGFVGASRWAGPLPILKRLSLVQIGLSGVAPFEISSVRPGLFSSTEQMGPLPV
jgi:hypothetical protein